MSRWYQRMPGAGRPALDVPATGSQSGQLSPPAEPPIFWQWSLTFLRGPAALPLPPFLQGDVKLRPGPVECHGWVLEWTYLRP